MDLMLVFMYVRRDGPAGGVLLLLLLGCCWDGVFFIFLTKKGKGEKRMNICNK